MEKLSRCKNYAKFILAMKICFFKNDTNSHQTREGETFWSSEAFKKAGHPVLTICT